MPPSSTPGMHVQLEADEFFYVLDGSGHIRLGLDKHEIASGDIPLHVFYIVDRPGLDEPFRLEFQGLDRTNITIAEFNAANPPDL